VIRQLRAKSKNRSFISIEIIRLTFGKTSRGPSWPLTKTVK
jgi:hypothetical protein